MHVCECTFRIAVFTRYFPECYTKLPILLSLFLFAVSFSFFLCSMTKLLCFSPCDPINKIYIGRFSITIFHFLLHRITILKISTEFLFTRRILSIALSLFFVCIFCSRNYLGLMNGHCFIKKREIGMRFYLVCTHIELHENPFGPSRRKITYRCKFNPFASFDRPLCLLYRDFDKLCLF